MVLRSATWPGPTAGDRTDTARSRGVDAAFTQRDHERVHRAEQLLEGALRAHAAGRQAEAYRLSSRALACDPPPQLRARVLLHHAYHVAERTSVEAGLAVLDEAAATLDLSPAVQGTIHGNRGVLLMRAGSQEALAALDRALALLPAPETGHRGVAHLNRGVVHLQRRELGPARRDFEASRRLALGDGEQTQAAKAAFNLGYAHMLAGDLPAALGAMDEVMPVLTELSPVMAAICRSDHAQVLLAAGLLEEAGTELHLAAATFGALRLRQDQAEAELALAGVLLAQEHHAEAVTTARRAAGRFARRGASTWQHVAERTALEAGLALRGRRRGVTVARAQELADALDVDGQRLEARRARLVGAEAALARGEDPDRAVERADDALRLRRNDPLAVRLHARRVRSAVAEARGDRRGADTELRLAVREIHRHQATLGSLDLRIAAGAHVHRIGATGLRRALERGSAAGVFAWSELARGMSSRLSPVTPPEDDRVAGVLERLRQTRLDLQAAPGGDDRLREQAARLEQEVREATWQQAGASHTLAPVTLARLRDALRPRDGSFVAHLVLDGRLAALVVTGGDARVHPLGPVAPLLETARRVRADLDVLAGPAAAAVVRTGAAASARAGLARVDELLWRPLRTAVAGGPVVLAPAAALSALPWTLLPGLLLRPVTVAATATSWLDGRPERPLARVAFVTGPDLVHAGAEVAAAAAVWPGAQVLVEARTADVLRVARTVDVLHVAAHGSHEPQSPLFSYLRFLDGPVFGHELHALGRLPAHVVLSACSVGRSEPRPGEEVLGMTAALLAGGAHSVVAGVADVADSALTAFGVGYHRLLHDGADPASALAVVLGERAGDWTQGEGAPLPLTCFGSGW